MPRSPRLVPCGGARSPDLVAGTRCRHRARDHHRLPPIERMASLGDYCAAAAVRVSRKAGITSFPEAVEVCELDVERGAERGCADDPVEPGIALLDRFQGLDDVLWPAGEEAAGL